MNPEQQRQHTRVTDILRRDLEALEKSVADELAWAASKVAILATAVETDIPRSLGNLTRAISDLTDNHVGTQDTLLNTKVEVFAFTTRGFWSRLNWLITGR